MNNLINVLLLDSATDGIMAPMSERANIYGHCKIENVGKQRSGRNRYWCTVHKANATGKYGVELEQCEAAYLSPLDVEALELGESEYPGGIGLWGAVQPVYDTVSSPIDLGVYVHARKVAGGKKEIDRSVPEVIIKYKRKLFEESKIIINSSTAVNLFISECFNRKIKPIYCTHCGELHLDSDFFAVKHHKKHLCHSCGKEFYDVERAVSNPSIAVRKIFAKFEENRTLVRSSKKLDIKQSDFPGGIRIWASNRAILWTSPKPEEEGIHVHGYRRNGQKNPNPDDTFDEVCVDGIKLNEEWLRIFMAQKSLSFLKDKLVSLNCPACSLPHFDEGEMAFTPHKQHECKSCGEKFSNPGKRKLTISNPFLITIEQLREAKQS